MILFFQQNNPLNLRVFHPLAQPSHTNICQKRNKPCSHLCLVTTDLKTKCLCPRNFILTDESTCMNPKSNNSRTIIDTYSEDETNVITAEVLIIIVISASLFTILILVSLLYS